MKTNSLLYLSHGCVAAACAAAARLASTDADAAFAIPATCIGVAAVIAFTFFVSRQIRHCLRVLESSASDTDAVKNETSLLVDFRQAARRIADHASRWEDVASESRRQAEDVRAMIAMLDRREDGSPPSPDRLRHLLVTLGASMETRLERVHKGAGQIRSQSRHLREESESQGQTLVAASASLQRLAESTESLTGEAASARTTLKKSDDVAEQVGASLKQLSDAIAKAHGDIDYSERKLLGLADPTRQLKALLGTINDIAARTELLALNASIESIRAGEQGRGFAVVADEVRKATEQVSASTQEIESLVESIRAVTDETVRSTRRQRQQVDDAQARAVDIERGLRQWKRSSSGLQQHVEQILRRTGGQAEVADSIRHRIDGLTQSIRDGRGSIESIDWAVHSMLQSEPDLEAMAGRLRAFRPTETGFPHDASVALPPTPDLVEASVTAAGAVQ